MLKNNEKIKEIGMQIERRCQAVGEKYPVIHWLPGKLFYLLCFLVLFFQMAGVTTFSIFGGAYNLPDGLLYMVFILGVFRIAAEKKNWKEIFAALFLSVVLYMFFLISGSRLFLIYGAFMFGTAGMEYRRLLKLYVVLGTYIMTAAVLGAFTGTLTNLVYLSGSQLRDSFGMIYPTDFASLLFYLLLFFWIAFEKIPNWVAFLLVIPFLMISYRYALSDTCTICAVALGGSILAISIVQRFRKAWNRFDKINRMMDFLLTAAFPFFAILMFALILYYSSGTRIGGMINEMLTGRLSLTWNAFRDYGVRGLGSQLTQRGNGGSTFPVSGYNFIDSTYPLILIRYGWILFIIIGGLWIRFTYRAVKARDYRLAFGMGLIAFHSLSEHHFIEINYNLLMFLPFAAIRTEKELAGKEKQERCLNMSQKRRTECFATCFWLAALLLLSPKLITGLRTVCGAARYKGSTAAEIVLLVATGAGAGVVYLLIKGTAGVVLHLKDKRIWRSAGKIMAGFLLLFGLILTGNVLIQQQKVEIDERLCEDDEAMDIISRSSRGKIFETEIPNAYRKKYKTVRQSIFSGEDLARYQNATVITRRGVEWYCFLKRGFVYIPISEFSSVYTNDESVIRELENEGYHATSYFSEIRNQELPIFKAPNFQLRSGDYMLNVRLVSRQKTNEREEIARILLVGNSGEEIIKSIPVFADAGTEEEILQVIYFRLEKDTPGMKCYVMGQNGYSVEVQEISYQAAPEYDVRKCYDEKMNLIKESYYSPEGQKIRNRWGYSDCLYSYDDCGRMTGGCFYDENGDKILNVSGYYEWHTEYGDNGRILATEYFGTDGELCSIGEGYSVVEPIYNSDGKIIGSRYYDNNRKFLFVRIPGACHGWNEMTVQK